MKHLSDSTLDLIDRASSKLGPLSDGLDKLVERVVPTVTASACGGTHCKTVCTNIICAHRLARVAFYASSQTNCNLQKYNCSVTVDCLC